NRNLAAKRTADDRLHDMKTEARSALACLRREEGLEDAWLDVVRNADAVVRYDNFSELRTQPAHRDLDPAVALTCEAMLEAVLDQVGDHLGQGAGIGVHDGAGRLAKRQRERCPLEQPMHRVNDATQNIVEMEFAPAAAGLVDRDLLERADLVGRP